MPKAISLLYMGVRITPSGSVHKWCNVDSLKVGSKPLTTRLKSTLFPDGRYFFYPYLNPNNTKAKNLIPQAVVGEVYRCNLENHTPLADKAKYELTWKCLEDTAEWNKESQASQEETNRRVEASKPPQYNLEVLMAVRKAYRASDTKGKASILAKVIGFIIQEEGV